MSSGSDVLPSRSFHGHRSAGCRALLSPVLVALAIVVVASGTTAGAPGGPHPRYRLFPDSPTVTAKLAERSADRRLTVVFAPESWACNLANATAARVVDRLADAYSGDTTTLYVIPAEGPGSVLFQDERSRETVAVPRAVLEQEHRIVPLPRLEIWTSEGELLLLRSLDKFEEDALYEELESSRSFLAERR